MANEIEQMLREMFGESWNKLTKFQSEQVAKITSRVEDLARAAVRDDLARLASEVAELERRVAMLEEERVKTAAEGTQANF
ncbi:MAG TPA: hypothetical protein VMT00_06455 [Thermoanaerobaculia bacterium]|nr:hypothetical protein [Thermoanaerobaculia bacterium]